MMAVRYKIVEYPARVLLVFFAMTRILALMWGGAAMSSLELSLLLVTALIAFVVGLSSIEFIKKRKSREPFYQCLIVIGIMLGITSISKSFIEVSFEISLPFLFFSAFDVLLIISFIVILLGLKFSGRRGH